MDSGELVAALAIQNIPGIGPTYAKRIVDAAGSFKTIFEDGFAPAGASAVLKTYLDRIRGSKAKAFELAEKQARQAEQAGQRVIYLTHPEYPKRLREIPDPPVALYIYGEAIASDELSLGVVGTRKATHSGLDFAREIGHELASVGITVVSGMALGIDAAAHRGALDADCGRTFAVLGTGADVCYPGQNKDIYDRLITERRGAILSEFPPGTRAEPYHFPMRNRIVSGMTMGVVVVEAPQRSGALITARMAVEQGREVFAVPHPARSSAGAGTNMLIREGAHLIEKVDDILCVIEHQAKFLRSRSTAARAAAGGAADTSKIYTLIAGGVTQLDDLVVKSDQGVSAVLSELTRLEIEGRIRRAAADAFHIIRA